MTECALECPICGEMETFESKDEMTESEWEIVAVPFIRKSMGWWQRGYCPGHSSPKNGHGGKSEDLSSRDDSSPKNRQGVASSDEESQPGKSSGTICHGVASAFAESQPGHAVTENSESQ